MKLASLESLAQELNVDQANIDSLYLDGRLDRALSKDDATGAKGYSLAVAKQIVEAHQRQQEATDKADKIAATSAELDKLRDRANRTHRTSDIAAFELKKRELAELQPQAEQVHRDPAAIKADIAKAEGLQGEYEREGRTQSAVQAMLRAKKLRAELAAAEAASAS